MFEARGRYSFNGSTGRAIDDDKKSTGQLAVNGPSEESNRSQDSNGRTQSASAPPTTPSGAPAPSRTIRTASTLETDAKCKQHVDVINNNNNGTSETRSEPLRPATKYTANGNGTALKNTNGLVGNSAVCSSSYQKKDYNTTTKINANGKPISQVSVSDRQSSTAALPTNSSIDAVGARGLENGNKSTVRFENVTTPFGGLKPTRSQPVSSNSNHIAVGSNDKTDVCSGIGNLGKRDVDASQPINGKDSRTLALGSGLPATVAPSCDVSTNQKTLSVKVEAQPSANAAASSILPFRSGSYLSQKNTSAVSSQVSRAPTPQQHNVSDKLKPNAVLPTAKTNHEVSGSSTVKKWPEVITSTRSPRLSINPRSPSAIAPTSPKTMTSPRSPRPSASSFNSRYLPINTSTANGHEAGERLARSLGHAQGRNGSVDGEEEEGEGFDHPFFLRPRSGNETPIMSNKGTVRGVRNRVQQGISLFVEKQNGAHHKDYRALERDIIVLYTTSMKVVRETHDKCLLVKKILDTQRVEFEERDVFASKDFHRDLVERLNDEDVELPQVFADGFYLGGAQEIERLNELGILRKIFEEFKKVDSSQVCPGCGGYHYTPCTACHGSKKSQRNRSIFTEEFSALRCTLCDNSGLVRCKLCDVMRGGGGGGGAENGGGDIRRVNSDVFLNNGVHDSSRKSSSSDSALGESVRSEGFASQKQPDNVDTQF